MFYSSRSIILKNRDLREADQLVTLFSEKAGKITAVAKGTKKPKSSLRACTQPFCHSYLYTSRGRELDIISQGKIIDFFGNTREDLTRMLYAVYMMELVDKSLLDRMPAPGLYRTLLRVLESMNTDGYNPLMIRFFEISLLVNLGYRPMLEQCAICGQTAAGASGFNLAEGGLICPSCVQKTDANLVYLSGESIALLKLMSAGKSVVMQRIKASPGSLKQMEFFLEKYLEYHLDRKFKMKNTIRQLKQRMSISN